VTTSAAAPTSPHRPALDHERIDRLRTALLAAAFTADGCLELLGPGAYAALARSETAPALRATRGGSPLEILIRLFLLQQPTPYAQASAVLPVEDCLADGWLVADGSEVRATVDVRPYANDMVGAESADAWVVSDLGCAVGGAGGIGAAASSGVPRRDLVLGVGGASTTLANITVRRPVAETLDIGCGAGVQALHAARHSARVTATDVNPRALHFTRLTLALSGFGGLETVGGSLFEPVADRRFDLIVSNPPFVISPGGRFTYRDGGLPGDELCRRLVRAAAAHLEPGGYCQLLANWQHVRGEDWHDRLAGWVAGTGLDAWVVQREFQDVNEYAELWLRDAGDHRVGADGRESAEAARARYNARYDEWLDAFEAAKVEGIGLGWITLRASGAERPSVQVEEWPHSVEQPLGPHIEAWFAHQDFLRSRDDAALLGARYRLAEEVVQEQVGAPGAEDPEHVILRQNRGMRRATKVDTVGAGFAGVCDGTLSAGDIVDAIARLLGEDRVVLRDQVPQSLRLLVEQGFIEPAD
jgi:methylase of polypeptide subunit release factors